MLAIVKHGKHLACHAWKMLLDAVSRDENESPGTGAEIGESVHQRHLDGMKQIWPRLESDPGIRWNSTRWLEVSCKTSDSAQTILRERHAYLGG